MHQIERRHTSLRTLRPNDEISIKDFIGGQEAGVYSGTSTGKTLSRSTKTALVDACGQLPAGVFQFRECDLTLPVLPMKIAIGSDHAGFQYKEKIRDLLEQLGHNVTDFGTHSEEPGDYPLFIRPVAEAVARREFERGIVLGGSGNGEAMVANRVKGVRCALCWNVESARLGRQHNDANVLSLGQRMMSVETALEIVRVWLLTPFEGGRHQHRIELIDLETDRPIK